MERMFVLVLFLCLVLRSGADEHSHKYEDGEPMVVWGSSVFPKVAKQNGMHFTHLPYCRGEAQVGHVHYPSIGEAFLGIKHVNTGFDIRFKEEALERRFCKRSLSADNVQTLKEIIKKESLAEYVVADIGVLYTDGSYYVFTRFKFLVHHHGNQIVDVVMSPSHLQPLPETVAEPVEIEFTYAVAWEPSAVPFAKRLENHAETAQYQEKLSWMTVIKSFVLNMLLLAVVAYIVFRNVAKALIPKELDPVVQQADLFFNDHGGWKALKDDVKTLPNKFKLFVGLVGTGYQLMYTGLLALLYALVFHHTIVTSHDMFTVVVACYVLTAFPGGFATMRLYTHYRGRQALRMGIAALLFWPLVVLLTMLVIRIAAFNSPREVMGLDTITVLGLFMLLVDLPLHALGAWTAYRTRPREQASLGLLRSTLGLPATPPSLFWYQRPSMVVPLTGLAIFVFFWYEMSSFYSSFWGQGMLFIYGLLVFSFSMMAMFTLLFAIVITYWLLNAGDHRWSWNSFGVGASLGLYMFLYSLFFFHRSVSTSGFRDMIVYGGYAFVMSAATLLIFGSISYWGTSKFVGYLYARLKNE